MEADQEHRKIIGMYGGSFNPLHNGHVHCIREALKQCDVLHIIVGDLPNRDIVPYEEKQRCFKSIFKEEIEAGRIVLHKLTDKTFNKQDYTLLKWLQDSYIIKHEIGDHIDVVFCGEDYRHPGKDEVNPYEVCYSDSKIVYLNRSEVPVSSTEIRANVVRCSRYLPNEVFIGILKHYRSEEQEGAL